MSPPLLSNGADHMQDTSALKEPFDVSTLESEVQALVDRGGPAAFAPSKKPQLRRDRLTFEPRLENDTEVVEPPRATDAPEAIPSDPINPAHYRSHPSGIECIEVTRHMNFNVGNAIKYIWRHMDKGDPIENLKKAQWYIDDEIRRLQGLR